MLSGMNGERSVWTGEGGEGAGAAAQPPQLRSGAAYASWRPVMDAWLESHGARGAHTQEMTPNQWMTARDSVEQWGQEAFDDAAFLLFGSTAVRDSADGDASNSGGPAGRSLGLTSEELGARNKMTQLVDNSAGVYGAIYSALPVELRPEIETAVRSGFAYGLWMWLECKYQSTEQDEVSESFTQWIEEAAEELVEPVDACRDNGMHAPLTPEEEAMIAEWSYATREHDENEAEAMPRRNSMPATHSRVEIEHGSLNSC